MTVSKIGGEMRVVVKVWWSTLRVDRENEGFKWIEDDLSKPIDARILNSDYKK